MMTKVGGVAGLRGVEVRAQVWRVRAGVGRGDVVRSRDCGSRMGGRGRFPDCQSARSCSRRAKMRAKLAAIRASRAAGKRTRVCCPKGHGGVAIGAPRGW